MMADNEYVLKDVFNERVGRIDDEQERQNHRIAELEGNLFHINKLTLSVEKMAVAVTNMQEEIKRQGDKIAAIEKEPADNWKTLIKTLITVVATAVVTFLLAKGGL